MELIGTSLLSDAAGLALERARTDLDTAAAAVLLADADYRVVDIRCTESRLHEAIAEVGVEIGVRLGEEDIGTNSVGTAGELRREVAVRGSEHFAQSFRDFDCYGAPVFHPLTHRLLGVLNLSSHQDNYHPLYSVLARRVVRDIQDQLIARSPSAARILAQAFEKRVRLQRCAVLAIGHRVALATRSALDMLDHTDHETLRALAELSGTRASEHPSVTLSSGLRVRVRIEPVEDTAGFLVELFARGHRSYLKPTTQQWPLLVVGEAGTGRTSTARAHLGSDVPVTMDAAATATVGETVWSERVCWMLDRDGAAMVIENIHLLSERALILLSNTIRSTTRLVALTSTPGEHLAGSHASLNAICAERIDLVPLRFRRHEIPAVAQRMLADRPGPAPRLTPAVLRTLAGQQWPGNLAELRRVIETLAVRRSCGDVVVADLPAHYRTGRAVNTAVEQAEIDTILSALESARGNKRRAAEALGMSRSTLYNKIHWLGIEV
ncbi:helix-turn-helix domain-containing protein [Nocardia vaccinii]|uniref:helix-turn-helix domain-containing protein n=1 Tax=Nocardia vaccinii TaxID=1822 RepID=UPI001470FE76|nr:helix-turn-helix domain-containing protein [Nocardia vaccinii]